MSAALAPPPAAPAPAAAPPASTPPTPSSAPPAPSPERRGGSLREEIGADFDEADKPRERGPDGKFKPADSKPPDPKPVEPPPEPKPGEVTPPAPEKPKGQERTADLRASRDNWQRKATELEPKVADLERQLAEFRAKPPVDPGPIQAQLKSLQDENARLQETVRFTAYKESREYLETVRKPLDDEWAATAEDINGFTVELADGTSRPVTTTDIMRLGDANLNGKQRQDLAREWFGDSAAAILAHVNNLRHLSTKEAQAVANAKTKAGERQTQMTTARTQQDAALGNEYVQSQTALATKYPKWFGPDPADAPGNELLTKGFHYADAVFNNAPVKQENGTMAPLTPPQRVRRLAVIRAKAANHDRLAARVKTMQQTIADLESDLAEFGKSVPGGGTASAPGAAPKYKSLTDEINADFEAADRKR